MSNNKELRQESGADSYLAEIKARQARKQKSTPATEATENDGGEEIKPKKEKSNLKIIVPQRGETKSQAVNFKVKPSLKKKFDKKCEQVGISQAAVLEQLMELFTEMDE